MKEELIYWSEQNYVYKTIVGKQKDCMAVFASDCVSFPYMEFGTRIVSKSFDLNGDCRIVIGRFKTKELCREHILYPPHYVREGKVL